jgi:hypothetical protein
MFLSDAAILKTLSELLTKGPGDSAASTDFRSCEEDAQGSPEGRNKSLSVP